MADMMEWTLAAISLSVALLLLALTKKKTSSDGRKLPPGPPGWPVIGNLLDLGASPHISLASLSRKYGPIIWLQLGAVNTMVVSSAEAAKDMFKNHDLAFADRATNEAIKVNGFQQGSLALGRLGPYWRMLRRLATTELFTTGRINSSQDIRRRCVDTMLKWVSDEKGSVQIARFVALMSFNLIGNSMFSKDVVDPRVTQGTEFFNSIERIMVWVGQPNVADLFPLLRWLDPQGITRKMKREMKHTMRFASAFVKERLADRQNGQVNSKKDFLDVMLDFQGNQKDGEPATISEHNILIMILELFTASTDTSTSTIEWALAELIRNPRVMKNVQAELDQLVGRKNKVEEEDIERLLYLQAVLKETLRLHPPIALLLPRRAMEDTEYMGYSIPKDTQILVNLWAIGRDPVNWDDPLSFSPERFLNSSIDFRGQHFEFMPFGAGRRMCVGITLAHRMLHLTLGSLIHSFEWSLEDGAMLDKIDMSENMGITLRKAIPVKAILRPRGTGDC